MDQLSIHDLAAQVQQELSRENKRPRPDSVHERWREMWFECYQGFLRAFGYLYRVCPTFEQFYSVASRYSPADLMYAFSRQDMPPLMYQAIHRAIGLGDWPAYAPVSPEPQQERCDTIRWITKSDLEASRETT